MLNYETIKESKELVDDFISSISFGGFEVKHRQEIKIEDYSKEQPLGEPKIICSGFAIIELEHTVDNEVSNKACIYITITKDILFKEAFISFFEGNITTPIPLLVDKFNTKTMAQRLEKELSNNFLKEQSKSKI